MRQPPMRQKTTKAPIVVRGAKACGAIASACAASAIIRLQPEIASRDGPERLHLEAARDLELRQYGERREHPLDDHPHVRPRVGGGDEGEESALVHALANRRGGLGGE